MTPTEARIQRLEALLSDCLEQLENFVDVEDGSYGEPRPNWAMQLCSEIERALGRGEP